MLPNFVKRMVVKKEAQMAVNEIVSKLKVSPQTKRWLIGGANAAISGAASSLGALAAGVTFKQGAIIVAAAALVSFKKWLVQHPLQIPEPQGEVKQ